MIFKGKTRNIKLCILQKFIFDVNANFWEKIK